MHNKQVGCREGPGRGWGWTRGIGSCFQDEVRHGLNLDGQGGVSLVGTNKDGQVNGGRACIKHLGVWESSRGLRRKEVVKLGGAVS